MRRVASRRSAWHDGVMNRTVSVVLALAAAAVAIPAVAAQPAPVPTSLLNRNAVVCVKVTPKGTVSEAFVIRSTGDSAADADMIAWIRTVNWPAANREDKTRNTWQPVPVAMGTAAVPVLPESCAPPKV